MKTLDCGEGERLVINEDIILSIVEITDDEVYLESAVPEGIKVCVEDVHHYAI